MVKQAAARDTYGVYAMSPIAEETKASARKVLAGLAAAQNVDSCGLREVLEALDLLETPDVEESPEVPNCVCGQSFDAHTNPHVFRAERFQ